GGQADPATVGLLLPATFDLIALNGNLTLSKTDVSNLLPSNTGTINLVAAGSISLGAGLAMLDIDSRFTRYIGSNDTFVNLAGNSINLLG
ncbi:hypothetical protein ABTJ76_20560, partial [Acinetobacter baumannii]